MARAKAKPQELAPFLSQHSAESDWPLLVAVDDHGRTIHACADCGAEIPDGVRVERVDADGKPSPRGRVVAYSVTTTWAEQPDAHQDSHGGQYLARRLVETERVVHHDCGGDRG